MTLPSKSPSQRRRPYLALFVGLLVFGSISGGATRLASDDETPIGPKWWPSEWGAEDQRGAANRLTAAKVLEANRLIQTGKIYSLGRVYERGMPLPGDRHFVLTIPGSPTRPPSGKNQLVSFDEMFTGEIGQIGTQLDGLGHIGVHWKGDDYFYNGFKRSEFADAFGHKKLGVENVGVFFTRGLLLDVARVRNQERLPIGYVITPADLQACLDEAGLRIRPGDVVLVRTGHGTLWMKDNKQFVEGEPGLGMAAARWLSEQKITLIGADNFAIEVVPSEDKERPFPVHQWNLVRHGIYHLEILNLEELAADKVSEFAFVLAPLRLKGATGSPGNPIAVR
jgi:kynurenine formamidase